MSEVCDILTFFTTKHFSLRAHETSCTKLIYILEELLIQLIRFMKLKNHEMISFQGQITEAFQTVSSGSGDEDSDNGWHYTVTRSQMSG